MRRAGLALFAAITIATPTVAQETTPADDGSQQQLNRLQEQLVAARQQIAQLSAENGGLRDQAAALVQCREKNGRLVAIGNDLIASYQQRYHRGRFLPFENGRRRFEAELQEVGDRVYDNRLDAAPRLPAATDPPSTDTPRDEP